MVSGSRRPGEFELIAKHFAPLVAEVPGAFGLVDDGACLTPEPGRDIVLTADAMIAGRHFLADDPPDQVARKLLRVNLSDLAAMGARPLGFLMTCAWSEDSDDSWIEAFAAGLGDDARRFGCPLLGGDTTATEGPVALSLTALGSVPHGRVLRRQGARPGDLLAVTGTIGDGALGLAVQEPDGPSASDEERAALVERYRLPQPRLAFAAAAAEAGLIRACLDISDGLVGDFGHLAEVSGVALEIEAARVPLSRPAARLVRDHPDLLERVLTGGDDYELAMAVSPDSRPGLEALGRSLDLDVTIVGRVLEGGGVTVRDAEGRPLGYAKAGWTHF